MPPLNNDSVTPSVDAAESLAFQDPNAPEHGTQNGESWIALKVSVFVNLVELSLHTGIARDTSLATVQVFTCCRFFPH